MIEEDLLQRVVKEMTAFRRRLHSYPEPAFAEFETARAIVERLSLIPHIEIREGVAETGIVALLGKDKKGPCIALRADMDCLGMEEKNTFSHTSTRPGFMHGCGHDGHIACLLGAAIVLGQMQDRLPCPVKLVFQPAEENYGGAAGMVEAVCLTPPIPRAIFALHGSPTLPLGMLAGRKGAIMAASRYFTITLKGKGTHAAMPDMGNDTILAASQVVCAAHTIVSRNVDPLSSALLSIPKFHGGTAANVLPELVELEGTLRALSTDVLELLERRLEGVVKNIAGAHGVQAEMCFDRGYPLVSNDEACFDYLMYCAADESRIAAVQDQHPPSMGAEDFSFFLEKVPGVFCWLGLAQENRESFPLHSPFFDFNDEAIIHGIAMHCRLALMAAKLDR